MAEYHRRARAPHAFPHNAEGHKDQNMKTIAADIAAAIRRQRKRSGKTDTGAADDAAARRGHLNTKIGFGASETWTAWEFEDGSRLLMNHQMDRTWVPVARRHRDLADGALRRRVE